MRSLTKVAISTLVLTLATPASFAFAAGSTEATSRPRDAARDTLIIPAPPAAETTAVTRVPDAVAPSPVLAPSVLKKTLARAVAVTDPQGVVTPKPASTKVRAQYSGGGKGQMITMLVSTVVGLAATVYMLRYLNEQTKKAEEELNPSRRR